MKILVDLRSLQSENYSGVENYTFHLVLELLKIDKNNFYILFFNKLGDIDPTDFNFINAKIVKTSFPNKLLNVLFRFKLLTLEQIAGEFDVLFMPNLNVVHTHPKHKRIVSFHDLSFVRYPELYDLKRRFWHWFIAPKRLLKQADKIVAVSNYSKNDLTDWLQISPDKIQVIYPGVDENFLLNHVTRDRLVETRNFYGLPKKYFLFLNTIEPRKNLANIIKAFENFKGEEYLVIAGKLGWKTASTLNTIRRSPKRDKIIRLGYVEEAFKPALIKLATAVLYPSYYEGFGFQVLEANLLQVPVIASQVTALPEIAHARNLLVNPQNLRDLELAMETLAQGRMDFSPLNLNLTAKFNWHQCAKHLLKTMEAVCV